MGAGCHYLTLMAEDPGQSMYPLREVFDGVRYIVKTGAHWRTMPHDLPPWLTVYPDNCAAGWLLVALRRSCRTRTCSCDVHRSAAFVACYDALLVIALAATPSPDCLINAAASSSRPPTIYSNGAGSGTHRSGPSPPR